MTECGQCGDCCTRFWLCDQTIELLDRPLPVHPSLEPWEGWPPDDAAERWREIEWFSNLTRLDDNWFSCQQFDASTKLCTIHERRPNVCRGFPWYGKAPSASTLRTYPACSFWQDVDIVIGVR